MHLQNDKYYRNAAGDAVHCQLEGDGCFHIYNVEGDSVEVIERFTKYTQAVEEKGKKKEVELEQQTHVEGWHPIGKGEFEKDKAESKSEKVSEKDPKAKKKVKKSPEDDGEGVEKGEG